MVATFPRPKTWHWTKRTVIGCLTCRSNGLMGRPWPMKATIDSRPSTISLKVWLHETISHPALLDINISHSKNPYLSITNLYQDQHFTIQAWQKQWAAFFSCCDHPNCLSWPWISQPGGFYSFSCLNTILKTGPGFPNPFTQLAQH